MRSSSAADDTSRLLSLDDAGATNPAVAGAKAAGLALARQAGLPVVPGYVVRVAEASDTMLAGQQARQQSGDGSARRAALAVQVDPALVEQLSTAVSRLGGRVIVRSSSPLESDHRWSGAFSSLNEIGPEDVAVAVRSCWASVFAVDPLERAEQCGVDPADTGLAVLVQPELVPTAGGIARVEGDEVQVTGVDGHPGALLAGWVDGATDRFGGSAPSGTTLTALVGADTVARVVEIALAVSTTLGDDVVEWAAVGDETYVLQTSRTVAPASNATMTGSDVSTALRHPCALEFARLIEDFPSPDAARYLLPWVGGTQVVPAPASVDGPELDVDDVVDLEALYRSAMRQAWGGDVEQERAAEQAVDALGGDDAEAALDLLASAAPVDYSLAHAVLRAVAERRGGPAGEPCAGADRRWSPFVATVVLAHGRRVAGTVSVPGGAVGRLAYARPHAPAPATGGRILLCDRPLPALAPLLFGAAALVTLGGPVDSHLAEVARSLGVPTLVGAPVSRLVGPLHHLDEADGWLGAIDAARGELAVVPRSGGHHPHASPHGHDHAFADA